MHQDYPNRKLNRMRGYDYAQMVVILL